MRRALRRRVEPLVRRWWQGSAGGWGPLLTALALIPAALFATVVRVRALLYDRGIWRPERAPIPVVSVGNLTVGGTGKTPVTSWVVSELLALGCRPAIVLRGYGGDEARLHARWHPDVPVIRAPDRGAGVREAAGKGCDVAVLDDGFQHRNLGRDLDLVLLSPAQPLPARLLPRGPWREPLRAIRRAQLVFVTWKDGEEEAGERLLREVRTMSIPPRVHPLPLTFSGWRRVGGEGESGPPGEVLALASVANPESFQVGVSLVLQREVELLAFPDHHDYSSSDAARVQGVAAGRAIVTTEKDAVKLESFLDELPETHVFCLGLRPSPEAESALRGSLADVLARGKERVGS
jgi:tetraacyldisaccharide 4'-kinase